MGTGINAVNISKKQSSHSMWAYAYNVPLHSIFQPLSWVSDNPFICKMCPSRYAIHLTTQLMAYTEMPYHLLHLFELVHDSM